MFAAAAGILAWLVLSAPVLAPGRQLGERDTARLYYPVEKTVAAALRAGRLPLWDSRIECGTSILGQVTPAALHPFALLYLPLSFGFAFKLEHLLALLLGGCGAAILALQLGASRWPALFAGIAFGGSGALVSAASGNLPYALGPGAAPLALGAVLWYLRAPSAGRLLASSFALALCAYGGDPQSVGIAILAALVLAVAERPRPRRAVLVLSWAACGLLLCAPVALPAVSQLQRSDRRAGVIEGDRKLFFVPPVRLVGLAVPLAFDGSESAPGEVWDPYSEFVARELTVPFLTSICLGAPALLFALALRRRAATPLLVLATVLAAASTGAAWHVQPVLEAVIPGWGLFRYPEKLLLHVSWLVPVIAALGAQDALLGARSNARRIVWLGFALAGVALGLFLLLFAAHGSVLQSSIAASHSRSPSIALRFLESLRMGAARVAGLSAAVAAIGILRILRDRSEVPAALAAAAAAASCLIAPPLRTVRADLYEGISATARKLFEIGGPSDGHWRVWSDSHRNLTLAEGSGLNLDEQRLVGFREALWPQLQALDGIDGAGAYFSVVDADYSTVLQRAPNAALDFLAIRFYVVQPGRDAPRATIRSDSGFGILKRPPSPRAFVVHRTRRAETVDASIPALRSMKLFEEAVVPKDGPVFDGVPGTASAVELRRPFPERIEASVDAAAPGLLVVSERYDPGWRAQLDGREVPVHRADAIVMGIAVPQGRHEVRLRFVPAGFVLGSLCAVSTVLALAGLALRRRGAHGSPA